MSKRTNKIAFAIAREICIYNKGIMRDKDGFPTFIDGSKSFLCCIMSDSNNFNRSICRYLKKKNYNVKSFLINDMLFGRD